MSIEKTNIVNLSPKGMPSQGVSFSPAVQAGGFIYVSGQLGTNREGVLAGPDMDSQARQVFANIEAILDAAGVSLDSTVRLTCYVLSFDTYGSYARVRGEMFSARLPASTTVGVASLLLPGALLEVDAVALAR